MANRILISVQEEIDEPVWIDKVEPFIQKVLECAGYDGEEISLLFCNDDLIHQLNNEYRDIDNATDVLSFENGDSYIDENDEEWFCAGDIIISLDTLPVNSEYFEVNQDEELRRLLVHGILHLNGMDHGEEHVEKGVEPVCEMLKLQKQIMTELKDEKIIG